MDYKARYRKLKEDLRTTTGRNVLTFMVFFLISTVFWFLLALNDEVQKDYRIPLKLEDFPRDMTIISGNVPVINVTVKDKGSALAKFSWGATPSLKLRYENFSRLADSHLLLSGSSTPTSPPSPSMKSSEPRGYPPTPYCSIPISSHVLKSKNFIPIPSP